MRIISNFKDYYDCLSGYSKDDIVYHRVSKFVPKKITLTIPKGDWGIVTSKYIKLYQILGFCGKLYYRFVIENPKYGEFGIFYSFSIAEIDNFIREKFSDKFYRQFCGDRPKYYKDRVWNDLTKTAINSFLSNPPEHTQIFEEFKCPIFLYDLSFGNKDIEINLRLNTLGFQKIFNPYQAFQEISMYLGNMAFPNRIIPHISDEIMAEAKGFNKFSFRKDKGAKS